ncbi:GmrSD restriction endonuclease domain-containing protein [Marinobacter flavimaris]|uniref:GmrSD restriction endonuclease domain-containing protein n=1 Tax=Marinobacter flavimaris TaxID=262076 RepID=UPI001F543B67|nr:DUF1524 domain-containing protein [Marinobacter flavimaris]
MIQNAAGIDIDHIVPLAWSWDRGAQQWSNDKRQRFANDRVNLWPVEAKFESEQRGSWPKRMVTACRPMWICRSVHTDRQKIQT